MVNKPLPGQLTVDELRRKLQDADGNAVVTFRMNGVVYAVGRCEDAGPVFRLHSLYPRARAGIGTEPRI